MTLSNPWLVTIVLFMPPLMVALWVAARADANNRLVAVQVASTLTAMVLAAMTFSFDQSSFIDVALCLTLLAVPGTYLYALFMERWL